MFLDFLAEYQLEHYLEKQRAEDFAISLHRDLVADTSAFNINRSINNPALRSYDPRILEDFTFYVHAIKDSIYTMKTGYKTELKSKKYNRIFTERLSFKKE